jgi:RNA polymerase sigma-70 factor (ECF subfamily)
MLLMAPEDPEITELLARAGHGNHSAVEQLLARHRDRLRRMVAVRMDDRLAARVDPSDVVQETLAMAAQRLSEYLRQPPLPFYPWLRQIACNRLADLCRRHIQVSKRSVRREERLGLSDASAIRLADRVAARGSSPLKHLLREELRARVRAALAALATADREILILRHLEQLSFAESAAVLGITETAAKQRHVRALRRIRRLLDDAISEVS